MTLLGHNKGEDGRHSSDPTAGGDHQEVGLTFGGRLGRIRLQVTDRRSPEAATEYYG
jgi:hypothetical protein